MLYFVLKCSISFHAPHPHHSKSITIAIFLVLNGRYRILILFLLQEPDNIDKEFLRRWYVQHCDPYQTEDPLPEAPAELVNELSRRYIMIYETLTGQLFPDVCDKQPELSLQQALSTYFN